MTENDNEACQSPAATNHLNSPEPDDISEPERIPVLVVEFPLEGTPRALNSRHLSDDDVRRLTDWISSRATFPGLAHWADRLLTCRSEWTP
ncbi:MAG TPA: hypothetical protein VFV91_05890 [Gaiellaceae bacterium]|nr:hypothetical protein [Gaiellaceae bacterium]